MYWQFIVFYLCRAVTETFADVILTGGPEREREKHSVCVLLSIHQLEQYINFQNKHKILHTFVCIKAEDGLEFFLWKKIHFLDGSPPFHEISQIMATNSADHFLHGFSFIIQHRLWFKYSLPILRGATKWFHSHLLLPTRKTAQQKPINHIKVPNSFCTLKYIFFLTTSLSLNCSSCSSLWPGEGTKLLQQLEYFKWGSPELHFLFYGSLSYSRPLSF